MVFQRGSEWRKWDLHVHSPASAIFSGDEAGFIIQLGNSDCAVIGINDYSSVAGYKEVLRRLNDFHEAANGNKAYRESLEKLREKTLLPVIEFRMNNVVIGKRNNSGQRINFHIIFSDEVNPDDIETFIKSLIVKDQSIGSRYNDKDFLLNTSVDYLEIIRTLKKDATFKDKFLVWIPYDEYGGIGDINPKTDKLFKEGLIYRADILGSGNKKQADFFLWKDTKFSENEYREWFGKRKPCIKGSDSHDVNDEIGRLKDHESKPTNRYCWIKADPTFNGLKQIINEPEDRVFIGHLPHKSDWVKNHKTCFLSRVKICKHEDSGLEDTWFDCDLPLNHDMVAIVGNKGSGKSALADILALAGDTSKSDFFSFLDKSKFREKKLASHFEVIATWEDKTKTHHNLQNNPDSNKSETIKYIPQTYLETICTETSVDESSEFQRELRKVIFSHIRDVDRLGKESLEELISYKTEEIQSELVIYKNELTAMNNIIAVLEHRATPDFRQQIEESLKKKRQELEAHITNKPDEVLKPENLDEEQKQAYAKIEADLEQENKNLQALEQQIITAQDQQKNLTEYLALAGKIEGKLNNVEHDITTFKQKSEAEFNTIGLKIDEIITFNINRKPLLDKRNEILEQKLEVDTKLSTEKLDSFINQQKNVQDKINTLKNKLDAHNKRYQNYLQELKIWQKRKEEIEGSAEQPETLNYYLIQSLNIDKQLPKDIETAKQSRRLIVQSIHKCIAAVRDVYSELFAPVQKLIEKSIIIKEGFKLNFASAIIQRGFRRNFFDRYVSQGVNGSFCGKESADQCLEELLENYDFNDPEQAIEFAESIETKLNFDCRTSKKTPVQVKAQLRKHTTVQEFYDFLWSFSYLIPEYSLKLDGKNLVQLSPGERGALLLVFYLLVDNSDKPIIVDQPEENLDNQTVYHLLIPVIKQVKKRRQIIMVTHNPNIAVVCDAEQIIYASIDRAQKNRITYTTGSIEEPVINKHILDVLEGTRPAFDNRDAKYYE